jgi:hypothetical protein
MEDIVRYMFRILAELYWIRVIVLFQAIFIVILSLKRR